MRVSATTQVPASANAPSFGGYGQSGIGCKFGLGGRLSPLDIAEARATLAFALATQLPAREGREVRIAELGGRPAAARTRGRR